MSKLLRNSLWIAPLVFVFATIASGSASANQPLETNSANSGQTSGQTQELNQVTSVSQLSDVKPTDWAFQALQSLVERYGVIAGYPDGTFRGNRSLTRYEFAAGLRAALDKVNELIAAGTVDLVKKEDIETLQRLQEEYTAELATLRGRVDSLEARISEVEGNQFSTTTKLNGEVIFNLAGVFGGDRALNSDQWRTINAIPPGAVREAAKDTAFGASGRRLQDNTILSDRVRLNLDTSFTGKDRLRVRLEANNTAAFSGAVTGTNMSRLGWDGDNQNDVVIGKAFYRFPLGKQTNVIVDATGGEFYDNFNVVNPLFESASTGAVSRFGRFSPIYRVSNTSSGSNTGAGLTVSYKLSDSITLTGGYLARRANDPTPGRGLFDGSYGALAQLAFQPNKDLTLALAYGRSYLSGANGDVAISGNYGSAFANQPFGSTIATSSNQYGLQTSYRINPNFVLGGWVGYTQATAETSSGTNAVTNVVNRGDKADIWNWAVTLGFPDLGKRGNLGGIIFGQPPKVTSNDFGPATLTPTTARRQDSDSSFHLEALYRHQVNNNISITPGLIVIFNPENNGNNNTIYTGVLRTTFRF
jgi:BMFP domain-containing protein YqiC